MEQKEEEQRGTKKGIGKSGNKEEERERKRREVSKKRT